MVNTKPGHNKEQKDDPLVYLVMFSLHPNQIPRITPWLNAVQSIRVTDACYEDILPSGTTMKNVTAGDEKIFILRRTVKTALTQVPLTRGSKAEQPESDYLLDNPARPSTESL